MTGHCTFWGADTVYMALLMGASMAIAMLGFISDLARNMARFYVLTIDPTLFGETALVSAGRRGPRVLAQAQNPSWLLPALLCGLGVSVRHAASWLIWTKYQSKYIKVI